MTRTFNGGAVPRAAIQATVEEIVAAVLAGRFSQWRYENDVGRAQLAGLSAAQVALWREPTSVQWGPTLRTHEDAAGEHAGRGGLLRRGGGDADARSEGLGLCGVAARRVAKCGIVSASLSSSRS